MPVSQQRLGHVRSAYRGAVGQLMDLRPREVDTTGAELLNHALGALFTRLPHRIISATRGS